MIIIVHIHSNLEKMRGKRYLKGWVCPSINNYLINYVQEVSALIGGICYAFLRRLWYFCYSWGWSRRCLLPSPTRDLEWWYPSPQWMLPLLAWGEREGGREGGREEDRERDIERKRETEREREKERDREREGGRERQKREKERQKETNSLKD